MTDSAEQVAREIATLAMAERHSAEMSNFVLHEAILPLIRAYGDARVREEREAWRRAEREAEAAGVAAGEEG